jgi:transcriptional antiterminator RfaH
VEYVVMSRELEVDTTNWYAIHTHPRQESRADGNLRAWRVETLAPMLKADRCSNGALLKVVKPLFPRYIFARFKASEMLHKVTYTRGVNSVVSFGGSPTPVDDQIIDTIRSRITEDGYVRLGEKLEAGDAVVIKAGPFKDFKGIFEREVRHTHRVMLLLDAINYQSRIEIPRELVKKINASELKGRRRRERAAD